MNLARHLNVDPELALRGTVRRFVGRVEEAERLAEADGRAFSELPLAEQDRYFDRAKEAASVSSSAIASVHGREILDSRGNPTVEVDVTLESGAVGRAAVPSGASTGEHEAVELRDGDPVRYLGKGVHEAVANVNGEIAGRGGGARRRGSAGARPGARRARRHADEEPSRRERDPRLLARGREGGGGTQRGLRSSAGSEEPTRRSLPVPLMNVINGGAHAQNRLDLQEFMVVPGGAETFSDALRDRSRGVPPPEGACSTSAGSRPESVTKAGSRPTSSRASRRSRRSSRRPSARATASSSASPSTPRRASSTTTVATSSRARAARSRPPR